MTLCVCVFLFVCFLCPEGQRGAEGGDRLADSPADVLGDHRQHVLLWRWASWARAAALTPGGHSASTLFPVTTPPVFQKALITTKSRPIYIYIKIYMFFMVTCPSRPVRWWVGGRVEQWWKRCDSRRPRWRNVWSDVAAVFVSRGSRSSDQPQHPWKGK